MSSENPEMSSRLLIKSVLLEIKALLQIQMLLPFTIQRIERVWVGALALFYWNSFFYFCSSFLFVIVSFCFYWISLFFVFWTSFLSVTVAVIYFLFQNFFKLLGEWGGAREGQAPRTMYIHMYMKGPNINQFWAKYQPAHFCWERNINHLIFLQKK